MPYTHCTPFERGRIEALYAEGKSLSYIAHCIGRHRSTISREITRNKGPRGYDGAKAQCQYHEHRHACRPAKKLDHQPLRNYVFEKITDGWTPEQISGRLPREYPDDPNMRISHETLYQALYADESLHCLLQHLPQARPKRRKRGQGKTRRGPSIPNRVGIEQRPAEVDRRERFGDWEGDTIVGSNQHAFIATVVDRKSLFMGMRKTDSKNAEVVAQAITETLLDMPHSWLKTITFDNGTEFAAHEHIANTLDVDVFFADPYSSFQRGTNENTNGLVRRFLPKGTDFRSVTQQQLDYITGQINNRPRKKLAYRTSNEVFQEQRTKALVALRA